jgi:hypothetical protein
MHKHNPNPIAETTATYGVWPAMRRRDASRIATPTAAAERQPHRYTNRGGGSQAVSFNPYDEYSVSSTPTDSASASVEMPYFFISLRKYLRSMLASLAA